MSRSRVRAGRVLGVVLAWLFVGAFLATGFVATPVAHADADQPVVCKLGVFMVSVSKVDTAAGSFDADFWMWSLCPDKETEPLKTLEFVNGVKVDGENDSNTERGKLWWGNRKFSGTFRQDFSMANYPFDKQTLRIQLEEATADTRALTYEADTAESKIEPALTLKTWGIASFAVKARDVTHPTTYGDPTLIGGDSTYASFDIEIGLERRSRVADFLKATFAVYVAGLLALVSLLIIDGRVGLLGATMFTVVLSFVSLDRVLGPHDSLYLLDKVHFATLAVIMAAGAWGVRSMRAVSLGTDKATVHRTDLRAAAVLFVLYLLTNAILIGMAIHG